MSVDDIQVKEDTIFINVPKTKNKVSRLFAVTDHGWIQLIKQYLALRPKHATTKRFFLTYRNERCTTSPIGINKISQTPKMRVSTSHSNFNSLKIELNV